MTATENTLTATLMDAARFAFAEQGLVLVPLEPTQAMLEARDEDGARIWDGGTEHYFRNREEAFWYARQVWVSMVSSASTFG